MLQTLNCNREVWGILVLALWVLKNKVQTSMMIIMWSKNRRTPTHKIRNHVTKYFYIIRKARRCDQCETKLNCREPLKMSAMLQLLFFISLLHLSYSAILTKVILTDAVQKVSAGLMGGLPLSMLSPTHTSIHGALPRELLQNVAVPAWWWSVWISVWIERRAAAANASVPNPIKA